NTPTTNSAAARSESFPTTSRPSQRRHRRNHKSEPPASVGGPFVNVDHTGRPLTQAVLTFCYHVPYGCPRRVHRHTYDLFDHDRPGRRRSTILQIPRRAADPHRPRD